MESEAPFTEKKTGLSRWAWIRAVLITLVLAINFIQASPKPGTVDKKALKDPIAMEELERWVDIFGFFGAATQKVYVNYIFLWLIYDNILNILYKTTVYEVMWKSCSVVTICLDTSYKP